MNRFSSAVLLAAAIFSSSQTSAQQSKKTTQKVPEGVVVSGQRVRAKPGYRLKKVSPSAAEIINLANRRVKAEVSCSCIASNPGSCNLRVSGDMVSCASTNCTNCSLYFEVKEPPPPKDETPTEPRERPNSEGGDTSAGKGAPDSGRTDPDRTLVSSPVRWEIKPNPELKGASGQIVFQFPKLTTHGIYEIAVFEIGGTKQITPTWYGSRSFRLLEGEYDVEINGMRLSRVPVKGGSDTRLHTGIIRFHTPGGTWVEVFDVNQKKPLCSWNGPSSCVVPPGEFHIKIGGSSKKVSIADGQVIDF